MCIEYYEGLRSWLWQRPACFHYIIIQDQELLKYIHAFVVSGSLLAQFLRKILILRFDDGIIKWLIMNRCIFI